MPPGRVKVKQALSLQAYSMEQDKLVRVRTAVVTDVFEFAEAKPNVRTHVHGLGVGAEQSF